MARPRKVFPDYPTRPHASGRAVIRVNGNDTYLDGPFKSPESKAHYERLRAEAYLKANAPAVDLTPLTQQTVTVADVLAKYTIYVERVYAAETKRAKQQDRIKRALAAVEAVAGTMPAPAFGPKEFEQVISSMCAEQPCGYCDGKGVRGKGSCKKCNGTGRRKWARIWVNHLIGCVKQAWDWAVKERMVPANPLRSVRGVRRMAAGVRESKGVRSVPRAAVQATVKQSGKVLADMIEIQYLACMRPEEVIGLTRGAIATDGVVPDVGKFAGVWAFDVPDGWNKNARHGQARVIFFGPKAQKILKRYLDRQQDMHIFRPREAAEQFLAKAKRTPNFAHNRAPGAHYNVDTYERAIKRAAVRAKVDHWTPLQLRHLRATEIRSQYSSDHARVVLGHHLSGVTGRYAEPDLEKAARVMREIG